MALDMYRTDYDGSGKTGTPAQMGMPKNLIPLLGGGYVRRGLEECTGIDPLRGVRGLYAQFWQGFDDSTWATYVETWGMDTISVFDTNHRNTGGAGGYITPLAPHFGMGLSLLGSVKSQSKRGNPEEQKWWH
jgi:hypothetical protein